MKASAIKTALVDSHPLFGIGLGAVIEETADLSYCGAAQSIASAMNIVRRDAPNVVVSEIDLASGNVFDLMEKVRTETEHRVKFVILTWKDDRVYLKRAMQLDASAYVLKTSDTSVILHAIRWAHAGGIFIDPSLLTRASGSHVQSDGTDIVHSLHDQLSDREAMTLRLIALGYSNKEVARSLGISPKSVETYKARAINKTGLFSRAKIVRYAMSNGWFDQEGEEARLP